MTCPWVCWSRKRISLGTEVTVRMSLSKLFQIPRYPNAITNGSMSSPNNDLSGTDKPDSRMPLILFNFDWQVTGCLEIMIDLDNFPALSERIEHVWTSKYGNHDLIRQGRALNMGYCYQVEIKIPVMEITTLFTEFKKHFFWLNHAILNFARNGYISLFGSELPKISSGC